MKNNSIIRYVYIHYFRHRFEMAPLLSRSAFVYYYYNYNYSIIIFNKVSMVRRPVNIGWFSWTTCRCRRRKNSGHSPLSSFCVSGLTTGPGTTARRWRRSSLWTSSWYARWVRPWADVTSRRDSSGTSSPWQSPSSTTTSWLPYSARSPPGTLPPAASRSSSTRVSITWSTPLSTCTRRPGATCCRPPRNRIISSTCGISRGSFRACYSPLPKPSPIWYGSIRMEITRSKVLF